MLSRRAAYRFTDKPIRRAGAFETQYFSSSETFDEEGTWLGAPNAALTGTRQDKPYVVIVTLYSPKYDNATHTLEYMVRRIHCMFARKGRLVLVA